MSTDALLRLGGVSAYYGQLCAIRNIDLEIYEGEATCVIGPNGAGKTTLLKAISGVLHDVRGSLDYAGRTLVKVIPRARVARGLVHVPEGRQIFTAMTVEENILVGGYTQPSKAVSRNLPAVLAMFPRLGQRRGQLAGTLSGGEQQMLAMARALMSGPKLLMLDEPSMGLSPIMVQEVYRQIDILRERGVTILLVEQNARIALAHSDRVVMMSSGEIRYRDSSAALMGNKSMSSLIFG